MARFDRGWAFVFGSVFLGALILSAPITSAAEEASQEVSAVVMTGDNGDTLTAFVPSGGEDQGVATEEKQACEGEPCEDGVCESASCDDEDCGGCDDEACEASETDTADAETADEEQDEVVRPTHKQVKVISTNTSDLPEQSLTTFCLTPDGQILAATAGGDGGDVRLFGPTGDYLTRWELPFAPEAINVGSDGRVYAAGGGTLARFTLEGELINEGQLPHAEALRANKDALRKEVIESHASQVESLTEYVEQMDEQIATVEKRIAEAAEAADKADDASSDEEGEKDDFAKAFFKAVAAMRGGDGDQDASRDEALLKSLKQNRDMIQAMVDRQGGAELTDEEIDQKVEASIAYKLKVASISEADGEVFVATGAEKGYGFCVWRTNRHFDGGEKIVDRLSGCCGQMDVQACEDGVCVAENGRHSVRRFDRTGERVASWGSRGRDGLEGFGGCCNPMNVAIGDDGSLYTAESGTGRVKRFSMDGELLDLVGKVDLVPGCKKVSIAVGPSGDRVYMLDITRNHIVLMERLDASEQVAYYETKSGGTSGAFFKQLMGAIAGE